MTSLIERIEEDRIARLRHLARPDFAAVARALESRVRDRPKMYEAVAGSTKFATSLDYHHPGQDAQTYLAHPMRVASLYLDLAATPTPEGVTLALVHNVLEVTAVGRAEVARSLGEEIYDALVLLTVDREQQWDPDYKHAYYAAIEAAPAYVGAIKVLDKVDNLYLLPLNPDDRLRARYLDEIERLALPLGVERIPSVAPLIRELVAINRVSGHRPLESWNLE